MKKLTFKQYLIEDVSHVVNDFVVNHQAYGIGAKLAALTTVAVLGGLGRFVLDKLKAAHPGSTAHRKRLIALINAEVQQVEAHLTPRDRSRIQRLCSRIEHDLILKRFTDAVSSVDEIRDIIKRNDY